MLGTSYGQSASSSPRSGREWRARDLGRRVCVFGQDSSFHNSQIAVKSYSRNLAWGIYPARLLASPLFPGRWLGKMLRGNRVRRPKMNLRHRPKDTCPLTFNQLFGGGFPRWRHSPLHAPFELLSLPFQPVNEGLTPAN